MYLCRDTKSNVYTSLHRDVYMFVCVMCICTHLNTDGANTHMIISAVTCVCTHVCASRRRACNRDSDIHCGRIDDNGCH